MGRGFSGWIARHGFALLVLATAGAAAWAGCATHMPASVPDFALMALHNRGFTDIGMNELRAQDMGGASLAAMTEKQRLQLGELRRLMARSNRMVRQLNHRMHRLEADSIR